MAVKISTFAPQNKDLHDGNGTNPQFLHNRTHRPR